MKRNDEKCERDPNCVNMLLLIVAVLHPRYKLEYVNWFIVNWFINYFFYQDKTIELHAKLLSSLKSLYKQYQENRYALIVHRWKY